MKLSEWARKEGISYGTAYKWFREGKMPVPARQLPSGTILVDGTVNPVSGDTKEMFDGKTVIYCRVSGSGQKGDLERQRERLEALYPNADEIVTEIGSGMNPKRRKLNHILSSPDYTTIIVEHEDRLTRFGFELIESSLKAQGRRIIVHDDSEVEDDIVQDITDFMTSVSARLYGRRAVQHRWSDHE